MGLRRQEKTVPMMRCWLSSENVESWDPACVSRFQEYSTWVQSEMFWDDDFRSSVPTRIRLDEGVRGAGGRVVWDTRGATRSNFEWGCVLEMKTVHETEYPHGAVDDRWSAACFSASYDLWRILVSAVCLIWLLSLADLHCRPPWWWHGRLGGT